MPQNLILDPAYLSHIILSVGGLGTAAFALVDSLKLVLPNGGISNSGFHFVSEGLKPLLATGESAWSSAAGAINAVDSKPQADDASIVGLNSSIKTLQSNFINGMALTNQKAIAKSLVKLNLTQETADFFARKAGMSAPIAGALKTAAEKMQTAAQVAMSPAELDAVGRLDLALSTLLDQCYQRADQRYRNSCKFAAVVMALLLAVLGAWSLQPDAQTFHKFFFSGLGLQAVAVGLLACPLAPIAKDLESTVQSAGAVLQSFRK